MDVFRWCRSCRANCGIFWVNTPKDPFGPNEIYFLRPWNNFPSLILLNLIHFLFHGLDPMFMISGFIKKIGLI